MVSSRAMVVGFWLLLAVAWNVEAFPVAGGDGGDVSDISDLAVAQGITREHARQREKQAVAQDIKELQLVEHLIDEKRGGKPLTVRMQRRVSDTTELSQPAEVGENDEPDEDMTGEQPAKIEDFEDKNAGDKREAEGNPFIPAANLVKSEENATATPVFKGPHADIDRRIKKMTRVSYKEIFGTANEKGQKMDNIKKDAAELEAQYKKEAKRLNIKVPKGPGPAKKKPTPDDPFAGVIPDHIMGAQAGGSAPALNFAGAGSGKRSGLTKGHGDNRYAHAATDEFVNSNMAGAGAPGTNLLGETANVAAYGHGKESSKMSARRAAALKKLTPPNDALTLQAVKLEEEEIVRTTRGKSAEDTVNMLDKFMHSAMAARNQNRRNFMAHKEAEAKKLYNIKQLEATKKKADVQPSADILAVREGVREAKIALHKGGKGGKGGKGWKHGGKGGKGHWKHGGEGGKGHKKGGKIHPQLRESNDPVQNKINHVMTANGKEAAQQAPAQQAPAQQAPAQQAPAQQAPAQQAPAQQEEQNVSTSTDSNKKATATDPKSGKTYKYDANPKQSNDQQQQQSNDQQKPSNDQQQQQSNDPQQQSNDQQQKQSNDQQQQSNDQQQQSNEQQQQTNDQQQSNDQQQKQSNDQQQQQQTNDQQQQPQQTNDQQQQQTNGQQQKQTNDQQQQSSDQQQQQQSNDHQQSTEKPQVVQSDNSQSQTASDNRQQQQQADHQHRQSQNQNEVGAKRAKNSKPHGDAVTAIEEQRPDKSALADAMAEYGPGGVACKDCN